MYDQKVEKGISRRKGNVLPVAGAGITIVPYHDLVSAEIITQTSAGTEAISLVLQNIITKDVSEAMYDAVICATGYERYSWMNLLKSSNIGKRFGLNSTSNQIRLAVDHDVGAAMNGKNGHSRALASVSKKQGMRVPHTDLVNNGSGMLHTSRAQNISHQSVTDTLYISRHYRLLPTTGHGFAPRIYLQGCTEETHGLSETLLSVMGIRAGELVADLSSR